MTLVTTKQFNNYKFMVLELNKENFKKEVLESELPAAVDFWAPWCGPCQIMGSIIDEIAEELAGKIKVGKVNVDENPDLAQEYDIMSIPAIKVFKGGKLVKEFIGTQNKEVLKKEISSIL